MFVAQAELAAQWQLLVLGLEAPSTALAAALQLYRIGRARALDAAMVSVKPQQAQPELPALA